MFVENHGLLFELDIVPYSINQPSRLCWIKMQIWGGYTMVQHAGSMPNVNHFISATKRK